VRHHDAGNPKGIVLHHPSSFVDNSLHPFAIHLSHHLPSYLRKSCKLPSMLDGCCPCWYNDSCLTSAALAAYDGCEKARNNTFDTPQSLQTLQLLTVATLFLKDWRRRAIFSSLLTARPARISASRLAVDTSIVEIPRAVKEFWHFSPPNGHLALAGLRGAPGTPGFRLGTSASAGMPVVQVSFFA
jgi:hypothetical protein